MLNGRYRGVYKTVYLPGFGFWVLYTNEAMASKH